MQTTQKSVTLFETQVKLIQNIANKTTDGDFSAALRNIVADLEDQK